MDLLVGGLPAPLARAVDKFVALLVACIGGFIAWSGQNYVVDALGATSAAIGYPTAWLYACAPVCGGLITLFAFEHLLLGPHSTTAADAAVASS